MWVLNVLYAIGKGGAWITGLISDTNTQSLWQKLWSITALILLTITRCTLIVAVLFICEAVFSNEAITAFFLVAVVIVFFLTLRPCKRWLADWSVQERQLAAFVELQQQQELQQQLLVRMTGKWVWFNLFADKMQIGPAPFLKLHLLFPYSSVVRCFWLCCYCVFVGYF